MWWQASFGMVAWHSWQIKHDKAWNFTTVYALLDFFSGRYSASLELLGGCDLLESESTF